jgi:periplasmic divalent cation tolerance protein
LIAVLIVKTTFAKREDAESAAKILVRERLAACASVCSCRSFFLWGGRMRHEREFALELKTADKNYTRLERRIKGLHSHFLPQIIAMQVKRGSREYLQWVEKS